TFGDRVAAARETSGMTQEQLAKRLGVKLRSLQQWEDDVAEPRANRLSMMAGMLNVSMVWLLTGEGDGVDSPEAEPMSADARQMLVDIRDIQTHMKQQLDRLGRLEKTLRKTLKDSL
ncbi:MAG: helix-turn-helix domain-containing protein, partial [Rhodobacterales bacterium]